MAVPLLAFSIGAIHNPVAGMALGGMMTRPIALLPLLLYGLYLFLQQQDTAEYVAEEPDRDIAAGRHWPVAPARPAAVPPRVVGVVEGALGVVGDFLTPKLLLGPPSVAAGTEHLPTPS